MNFNTEINTDEYLCKNCAAVTLSEFSTQWHSMQNGTQNLNGTASLFYNSTTYLSGNYTHAQKLMCF